MRLECILDTCPVHSDYVSHLDCIGCMYNPLGEEQPEFAWQECTHPRAEHKPDTMRWIHLKGLGSEVLSVIMTRKRYRRL